MFFLIFFFLFPNYNSEITFEVIEKKIQIKIISDGEKFRLELKGKEGEVYFKENDKIFMLQDNKWREIKSPIYNENNFFISVFFKNEKDFQIDMEKDGDGLKIAKVSSNDWGKVSLKRTEIIKLKKIPEDAFPKKSKFTLSKLKNLLKSEDEKEVSATAGARGIGEEENLEAEPNYKALEEIEKIKVSKEEVEKFAQEGEFK